MYRTNASVKRSESSNLLLLNKPLVMQNIRINDFTNIWPNNCYVMSLVPVYSERSSDMNAMWPRCQSYRDTGTTHRHQHWNSTIHRTIYLHLAYQTKNEPKISSKIAAVEKLIGFIKITEKGTKLRQENRNQNGVIFCLLLFIVEKNKTTSSPRAVRLKSHQTKQNYFQWCTCLFWTKSSAPEVVSKWETRAPHEGTSQRTQPRNTWRNT